MELREKMAEQDARSAPLYAVTFHPTIYDTDTEQFTLDYFEPNEFVRLMRSFSKDVIKDKTSNFMINSTRFFEAEWRRRRLPAEGQFSGIINDDLGFRQW